MLNEIWAQVFLQSAESGTIPVQHVLFSVLGLSFFQPAQRWETQRVLFSLCFFLDRLQDNEQWWTWFPQSRYLNWNGGVRHPQVLHGCSKPVSTSYGWAAVLTDCGFQRGLLFLEKQALFYGEGKLSFVQEVSFWREKTHPEPNTRSWNGSISPIPMRKCSWVTSKISVFWFCWLFTPLFLILSIVRSRKSIVLLSRLPNVAFLGSAISDLGHCKFNRELEASVS